MKPCVGNEEEGEEEGKKKRVIAGSQGLALPARSYTQLSCAADENDAFVPNESL